MKTPADYRPRITQKIQGRCRYWINEQTATADEKQRANLRTLLFDEVVLDLEEKGAWERVKPLLAGYSYEAYDTGSRGVHVHIRFNEMAKHPLRTRDKIRQLFLQKLPEADPCKKSENTMVAIPGKPHHKTGRPKTLLEQHFLDSDNILPPELVAQAVEATKHEYKRDPVTISKDSLKNNPFLGYCLNHVIPPAADGRHNILFKNLCALMVQGGLDDDEIRVVEQVILANCPETKGNLRTWISPCRRGITYNEGELVGWFDRYKDVLP